MFHHDESLRFVELSAENISALYQSANTAPVIVPGGAPTQAGAVIVGHRRADGHYGVLIAIHLVPLRRTLVLPHKNPELDVRGARDAAQEALTLLKAMGFKIKDSGWKDLDATARTERLASLKVFRAPDASSVAPGVAPGVPMANPLMAPAFSTVVSEPEPPDPASGAILLLDADTVRRLEVRAALRTRGLEVYEASRCGEADDLLKHVPVDLISVEGSLPDGPGFDWIKRLREKNIGVRVVFRPEHAAFFGDPRNRHRLMREFGISATFQQAVTPDGLAARFVDILAGRPVQQ
jgi:CheY-like chemotaxis protein